MLSDLVEQPHNYARIDPLAQQGRDEGGPQEHVVEVRQEAQPRRGGLLLPELVGTELFSSDGHLPRWQSGGRCAQLGKNLGTRERVSGAI